MAATKGNVQAVLVDEFIFNSSVSEPQFAVAVDEVECTTIASTGKEYAPLMPDWSLELNGYMTGVAADEYEAEMKARLGVDGVTVAYIPVRTSTNTPAYVMPAAFGNNMSFAAPTSGLITLNGGFRPSSDAYRGKLITYNTTVSGTGNGTSIDLGSAGSAGGYFFLHVHQIDDDTSGTSTDSVIKMQSSSDDSTFADEATITFSATGGYSAAMSGTVNRYIRISTTDLGGATTLEVTAIVYVANVT